jgi:hypothetical protein
VPAMLCGVKQLQVYVVGLMRSLEKKACEPACGLRLVIAVVNCRFGGLNVSVN